MATRGKARLGLAPNTTKRGRITPPVVWTPQFEIDAGSAYKPIYWSIAGVGDTTAPDSVTPANTRISASLDRVAGKQILQATEAMQPLRVLSADGISARQYNLATTRYLASTSLPVGCPTAAAGVIIIIAVNQNALGTDTTNNTKVAFGIGKGSLGQFRIGRFAQTNRNRVAIGNGTTSLVDVAADDTRNFSDDCVVVARHDGTTASGEINGYPLTPAAFALNVDATGVVREGANAAGTVAQWWDGSVYEAIIIPDINDSVARQAVIDKYVGYMARRIKLVSKSTFNPAHPYKTTAPTGSTIPTAALAYLYLDGDQLQLDGDDLSPIS